MKSCSTPKDLERNDRIEKPMRHISESKVKIQLKKMKQKGNWTR